MEEKKTQVTEKEIKVIKFEEVKNSKEQIEDNYFSNTNLRVTRGELNQILTQVLGNIDAELMESFKMVVATSNLMEVVVETLFRKGVIDENDLLDAQRAILDELKEDEENGSK